MLGSHVCIECSQSLGGLLSQHPWEQESAVELAVVAEEALWDPHRHRLIACLLSDFLLILQGL